MLELPISSTARRALVDKASFLIVVIVIIFITITFIIIIFIIINFSDKLLKSSKIIYIDKIKSMTIGT